VWRALSLSLNEDFLQAIKLINFTLRSIPIDTNDINSFIPIITQLMYKVADLDRERLNDTLQLINLMIDRTHGELAEQSLPVDEFFNFFVTMDPNFVENLKLAAKLCISLEKYAVNKAGVWLKFVTEEIARSRDMTIAMAGYECIANLMKR
jgi:hypothetical protein